MHVFEDMEPVGKVVIEFVIEVVEALVVEVSGTRGRDIGGRGVDKTKCGTGDRQGNYNT